MMRTYINDGDRCFAVAGQKLWNSLPADLRQADISFQRFKRLLKTFCSGAEIVAHCDWLLKLRIISFLLTYLPHYRNILAMTKHSARKC